MRRRTTERLIYVVIALAFGGYLLYPRLVGTPSSDAPLSGDHGAAGNVERRDAAQPAKAKSKGVQPQVPHPIIVQSHESTRGEVTEDRMHGDMIGMINPRKPGFELRPYVSLSEETLEMKREAHTQHCFNLKRSDSLPLDRPVPDHRDKRCKEIEYPHNLPTTSVIFVFYNEPLSPLYRSIHGVLDRTPEHLLHEIILVDDGSDADYLKKDFEDYIKLLPKTKLVRKSERSGLMDARSYGAEVATGDTITFLDAHIEVSKGWLEPMMARINEDRKHVVMPIIDSIDPDSFNYMRGGLDILGFSWGMGQKSIGSRRRTRVEPMPSPIMAGGLFSMDRKYFFDLGGYDPGMKLYGGEELEISFRIWQCGGTLECIPCSRVGHVFRTGAYWKGQVYTVPGHVIVKNKLRAAEVWMDEYKEVVQRVMPPLPRGMDLGDLSAMQEIRRKFQCKPFKWFLKNVYPEMFVPNDEESIEASGEIRNPQTNACFDTLGASHQGAKIGVYPCHHSHGTQEFVLSKAGDVRVAAMDFDNCLDRGNGDGSVGIWPCHQTGGNQAWKWDRTTGLFGDATGDFCVEVRREQTANSPFALHLAKCDPKDPMQQWHVGQPKSDN
ncbi:uncharacterized protein MONBRDRAFT_23972 [Monosiga brevicollis MX1]|uniref:Protein-UDP acetylgalactosaminyltransferase 7 n=1 Tax=Monosiga brevicollis TaxID=81824 RepID=A9UUB2_MONBE|nr:uncharacterized protein MONBRDRAFT_23972 [Monosiga brevicollis MX1]EDQ90874.1 predicted protein [Monosiga brevicollis MX1]|eukprot:XP_001744171.1 hypothetical protein [Monosiga brevicollis MX1]